MIVVVDNGSGANEIARLVRCTVAPPNKVPPASAYILSDGDMRHADANRKLIKSANVPVLAVGSSYVFLVEAFGGKAKKVARVEKQERLSINRACSVLLDLKKDFTVFQKYDYAFDEVPENLEPVASSRSYEYEILADMGRPFFAMRLLPERGDDGIKILRNFVRFAEMWEKYHRSK